MVLALASCEKVAELGEELIGLLASCAHKQGLSWGGHTSSWERCGSGMMMSSRALTEADGLIHPSPTQYDRVKRLIRAA